MYNEKTEHALHAWLLHWLCCMLDSSWMSRVLPFLSVVSESVLGVSGGWGRVAAACDAAAADDDAELFGGLYDWLPKFCLFSLALASSLSKRAIWHRSTVDTSNLQNWQQQETSSKTLMYEDVLEKAKGSEMLISWMEVRIWQEILTFLPFASLTLCILCEL